MKFITSEQFLKADTKVQNAILEWWKPSVGDLYCNLYNNQRRNVFSVDKTQLSFKTFADDIKLYGVPLLTEGQLREFIEENADKIRLIEDDIETLNVVLFNGKLFKSKEKDLLQALWEIVNKIVEEVN